jgi:antitoxin PrlF
MMSEATTLTSKGQITVPRDIRSRLGLQTGDKLVFTLLSDGTVVMRPKKRSLLELAGFLHRPGLPHVRIEDMDPGSTPKLVAKRLSSKKTRSA